LEGEGKLAPEEKVVNPGCISEGAISEAVRVVRVDNVPVLLILGAEVA
jgi:hypothetical protein